MNPTRKRRLIGIGVMFSGVALAVGIALFALRDNINLFYTPTQVAAGEVPVGQLFRVGGLVEEGSIQRSESDLNVRFTLTDTAKTIVVNYNGILPDLFREGQDVVANGRMNEQGIFMAEQVLAKHDENYRPPEVQAALDQARPQVEQL